MTNITKGMLRVFELYDEVSEQVPAKSKSIIGIQLWDNLRIHLWFDLRNELKVGLASEIAEILTKNQENVII